MRVGLCVIDLPPTLGGGYVLRQDVERAAVAVTGRHKFELIKAQPIPSTISGERQTAVANSSSVPTQPSSSSAGMEVRSTRWKLVQAITSTMLAQEKNSIKSLEQQIGLFEKKLRYLEQSLNSLMPQNPATHRAFVEDVTKKNLDLLWFNHMEPIHNGTPYILTIFDIQHRLQPWFPEVSANGLYETREESLADAIRRAWIVTVGSEEARQELSFFFNVPLDRVRVVPFPTPQRARDAGLRQRDGGITEKALREKYRIEGDFLFYPAQLWPHKNHVNLIHALHVLHQKHGLKLSLVLTGADHGNLVHIERVVSELGLMRHFHYLGFVPPEEVVALYRFAFALTYVSFFGPENLPPYEAIALGCPIVLGNIPGVQKLYGDSPVLVDHRDENSIAAGIKWLYDHPEQRRQRANSARDIALKNSAENYIDNVCTLLDEIETIRRCWP